MEPKVYIVVVNWNGWKDTIECLESVYRLQYSNFKVIVCDNRSSDESLVHIRAWAQGRVLAVPRNPRLANLVEPAVEKPLSIDEYEASGIGRKTDDADLVLIDTGSNLGFAGGNNVGIRYALAQGDCDFIWLLNNDTVVDPGALRALIERMLERPDAGMCGSTLLYYHEPEVVQALGGASYNAWTARSRHLGLYQSVGEIPNPEEIETKMRYVVGASMLVRTSFLEHIGLMNEIYFLYFEELDWSMRSKDSFSLAFSPKSIVYHKEGMATGQSGRASRRSLFAHHLLTRNRIVFTKTYFPRRVPILIVLIVASAIRDLALGRIGTCKLKISALFSALGFSLSSAQKLQRDAGAGHQVASIQRDGTLQTHIETEASSKESEGLR